MRLERKVRVCFARSEHMVLVFFDQENPYYRTWKHSIVQDFHSAGLKGYLLKFIREFLKNRVFQVRVGSYQSDVKNQINGVSQGIILTVLLVAL